MPQKPARLQQAEDGSGGWFVYFADGKRSRRKSLRTKDRKIAEARFQGWLDQRKLDNAIIKDPSIAFILDVWFDQWIQGRMQSEIRYPSVIKNLKSFFGEMHISTMIRQDSVKYADFRRRGVIGRCPASESTIRMELSKLRASFRFMVEKYEPKEGRLDSRMVPYIEQPAPSPPRDLVFSREDLDRIYDYSLVDRNRQIRGPKNRISREGRFCIIAMETAQRKTAILELKWDQVDWDKLLIKFNPYGRNQTSKRRPKLPISDRLLVLLKQAYEDRINEFVVDSSTDIHFGVKRIFRELGLSGSPHTFRHTWATHAIEDGMPILKVAKFLGDTEETVRENYEHLSPDYLRDVINRK